jgi:hypothetical protein
MEDYTIEVLPFLGAMLVVLFALSLFPQLTLFLPDLVYGKNHAGLGDDAPSADVEQAGSRGSSVDNGANVPSPAAPCYSPGLS